MKYTHKLFTILLCLGVFTLVGCSRHESQVDLGGVTVSVPNPPGYIPVSSAAPQFFSKSQSEYPESVMLLQLYLDKKDLREVLNGEEGARSSFRLMVERRLFGANFSQKDFDENAVSTRKVHDGQADRVAAFSNNNLRKAAEQSGVTLSSFNGPQRNEIFIDEKDAIGDATYVQLTVGDQQVHRLAASVVIRVHDRSLILGCSFALNGDGDVKVAEKICSDWAKSVLDANSDK
jgi:hypothetical protein